MNKQLAMNAFLWGFALWFMGYILGIVFFFFLPPALIGWCILPVGVAITLWVLLKKITARSVRYYAALSVVWTIIAIACDYFLLVQLFKPADGYYKPDVFLYYILTFTLPLFVYWWKYRE